MKRYDRRDWGFLAAIVLALVGAGRAEAAGPFDAAGPPRLNSARPAPAPSASAAGPSFTGVWSGDVVQPGRPGSYPVTLTINTKGVTTNYPDGPCAGTLKRVGSSGDYVFYSEVISKGRFDQVKAPEGCIDGTVTLAKAGDKLIFRWFGFHDDAIGAVGVLSQGAPAVATKAPANTPAATPALAGKSESTTTAVTAGPLLPPPTPAAAAALPPAATSAAPPPPAATSVAAPLPAAASVAPPPAAAQATATAEPATRRPPYLDPVTNPPNE